jgi:hypothetical protein
MCDSPQRRSSDFPEHAEVSSEAHRQVEGIAIFRCRYEFVDRALRAFREKTVVIDYNLSASGHALIKKMERLLDGVVEIEVNVSESDLGG